MAKTIIATFVDKKTADHAVRDLLDYGFRNDEISIITHDQDLYFPEEESQGTILVEAVATGLVAGAVIGGLFGFFVGIGFLTIPGFYTFLIDSPLMRVFGLESALATTVSGGIYGALVGAVGGFIIGLINPSTIRSFEEGEEGVLIALPITEPQEFEVKDLILEAGASNIKILDLAPYEEEEQYREYYGGYGLAGIKGGKTNKKTKPRNDPVD